MLTTPPLCPCADFFLSPTLSCALSLDPLIPNQSHGIPTSFCPSSASPEPWNSHILYPLLPHQGQGFPTLSGPFSVLPEPWHPTSLHQVLRHPYMSESLHPYMPAPQSLHSPVRWHPYIPASLSFPSQAVASLHSSIPASLHPSRCTHLNNGILPINLSFMVLAQNLNVTA